MHNKAGWKLVIKSQGDLQPSFERGTKEPPLTMGRSLFLAESQRNRDGRDTKPISPAVHRNAFQLTDPGTWSLVPALHFPAHFLQQGWDWCRKGVKGIGGIGDSVDAG